MLQPKEVLASILKDPMNIDNVRSLVADDVTSLLKRSISPA